MSNKRKRLEPTVRKEQILNAAVVVAEEKGYSHIQRYEVAVQAQCSEATVSFYFGTMHKLKTAVLKHAVKSGIHSIIAQGVVAKDRYVMRHTDETIRVQALKSLA